MPAQVSRVLWTPKGYRLTAKPSALVVGPACCTRLGNFSGRQAARHGASTTRGVLHGNLGRRRPGHLGGRAAMAVRAAGTAAQDLYMQDRLLPAGPAPDPSSLPRPQASWLPSAADFMRLWAPALGLIALTGIFDARGLAYLMASVNLHLLIFFAGLPILHRPVDNTTTWIFMGAYTYCALCLAGMYALIFCDQGLSKVVLVKSWLRIAIGLPLRLYDGINTPSGAILTGCMRGLMSWTGRALLARAALRTFINLKEARSKAAAAPAASQEVEEADSGVGSIRLSGHETHFRPATTSAEAVSAAIVDAGSEEDRQNTAEARLLYLQQGVDRLEAEATFIKEDKLRHHWNPADLQRWQEAVARLDSLRQEVTALTAGAPAAETVQQEPCGTTSSLTEETRIPDWHASQTEAQIQAHPEEVLGRVAEKQPAETQADTGQPAGSLLVSPEVEGGHQPKPTEAGKTMSRDGELEAVGSNELLEEVQEADLDGDSAVDQGIQDSDEGTQHDSMQDLWDTSGAALLQSVQTGNLEDVDWLLGDSPSCDVDVRDSGGRTPLHIAAELGSLDIVNLLLSLDATHSKLDNKGRSPLYAAALAGHPDIVKVLLDAGADHGKAPSPLHFVQDPKVLAVLLEDGADEEDSTKDGETPLLAALRCGYMEAARTHLAYVANPRIIDFNDNTALKHALRHGDADMVTLLLRKEMSDTPDWYEAPLLGAVKEGNVRLMQAILDANDMPMTETWEMAMIEAAKCNHAECMSALLDTSDLINSQGFNGCTPLMMSAAFGSVKVLKLLLAAGANVDVRKHFEGLTALHLAAISGSAEVVHSLLENGADPAPRDCNGHTAAELAHIFGREELVAILAPCPSKEENAGESDYIDDLMDMTHNDAGMPSGAEAEEKADLLGSVADTQLTTEPATAQPHGGPLEPPSTEQSSQPEAAQAAVASAGSANIEAVTKGSHSAESEALPSGDPDGSTDIHQGPQEPATGIQHAGPKECEDKDDRSGTLLYAVEMGKPHDVERLLKAGWWVDGEENLDRTPLYTAAMMGKLEIVKLLLAHGAEPSRPSWGFPHAPLNVAAIEGHRDVVKALLDAGADYRRAPSPLCYVKDPDVLVLLLEAGADVDAIRGDGDTPLLTAICGGHYEAAETLLCAGARPTLDRFGFSPLMLAIKRGSADMVKLLLRKGMCHAEAWWTPLVYAAMEGNVWWMTRIINSGKPEYEVLEMAMLAAAKWDHADCMPLLLFVAEEHDVNFDGQQCTGLTPLMVAAAFGSIKVLRLLMEAGADVDARSRWEGLTALHLAAIFGHTEAAHALLEHGASKAICNHSNHTAAKLANMFGQAAFGADLTLLPTTEDQPQAAQAARTSRFNASASSECDDSPEASEGFHGGFRESSTPVHRIPLRPTGGMQHGSLEGSKYANSKALLHAVRLGRSQDVERLLNAGCNVDVQDADGFTPIYHAAREGFKDIVELLLVHGANASSHPLPMHPAVLAGHRDVVKTLLAAGADLGSTGEFGVLRFAEIPDPELLATLLGAGADVNAITEEGQTPLMLALCYQCSEVVETLLDYGARADMCDDLGRSPLKYAAEQGDAGSVDLLLRSLTCDSSWPPLSLVDAVRRGDAKMTRASLDAEEKDQDYVAMEMAMMSAARGNQAECMSALLAAGSRPSLFIDIDTLECGGLTPLMVASAFGSVEVVRLLLGAGADVGACTAAEGLTALHLAAVMGHAEVAHLLIEGGACTTTFDNNDDTAVDLAFTAGQEALGNALSQLPTDEDSTEEEDAFNLTIEVTPRKTETSQRTGMFIKGLDEVAIDWA